MLPLLGPILILGFLHMILCSFFTPLGYILKGPLCWLTRILIHLVHYFADLDLGILVMGRTSIMAVILYYLLLLSFLWPWGTHLHLKRGCQVLALCTLAGILGMTKWRHSFYDDLVLTCLDVGHGQAIVIQYPPHTNWIFDAGALYKDDIGRRIVDPFLDEMGIGRVHALFLSHPDMDHINGVPSMVYYRRPRKVYMDTGWLTSKDDQSMPFQQLLKTLEDFHVPVAALDAGVQGLTPAGIQRLWPNPAANQAGNLSDNNRSSVLRLNFSGRTILLCADIEQFAQQQLMHLYPDLQADAVVAPHHGSLKTLDPDFLDRLGPEIVLCSCGLSQYQQGVVGQDHTQARIYYTAQHGAIRIRITKTGRMDIYVSIKGPEQEEPDVPGITD